METLGERVRRLRLESDEMTQDALAAQVPGMSASAISQLENGNSKGVKPENLLHLAQALGVSMHELVTGKPEPAAGRSKAASTKTVRHTDPQEEKLLTAFRKLAPDKRAVVIALTALLAACATQPTYTRAGATADEVRIETAQCREKALTATAGDYSLPGIASRDSIQRACMEGKGWRPQ